jgi:hypothetical protein
MKNGSVFFIFSYNMKSYEKERDNKKKIGGQE